MFWSRRSPQASPLLQPALTALQAAHPDLTLVRVVSARELLVATTTPLRRGGREARLVLGNDGTPRYVMHIWNDRLRCNVLVYGRYAEGLGRWFVASSAMVATGRRTRRSRESADSDYLWFGLDY